MATLPETTAAVDVENNWTEGIYQLEEEDVVLGGPEGIDNLQAKQLIARTNRLKALILSAMTGIEGHEAAVDPHPQYLIEAEANALIATAVAALLDSTPATLDTLNELAAALGDDPNFAATMATALGLKAPLANAALTGTPTAPTAAPGTNTTQLATTAFVAAALAGISMAGYAQLAAAQEFTAKQTFTNTVKLQQILEKETITASAPTTNFDCLIQGIRYFTSNASANWTQNFRGDGSNTLNSIMEVGESITVTIKATQGATPYFPNVHQIDGNVVTPKWLGGTAPTSGDSNSINVYTYTITKTAAATFTVLASKSKYA